MPQTTLFSPLCQLNGGCMGCCGHDFVSKEKIKEAIRENTSEFRSSSPQTKDQLLAFRDRAFSLDLRNGVCRNLIEKNCQFICPLHPYQNQGKDLRLNHCDINHLCQAAQEFRQWPKPAQQAFLKFISSKKLDNLNYSILMDNNSLLEEFKSLQQV